MRKVNLVLEMRNRLTITESMCLNLLWCIVFGPNGEDVERFTNTGGTITYRDSRSDKIAAMGRMLVQKNWNDDEFAANLNSPEVQAIMAFLKQKEQPSFDEVMEAVFSKIRNYYTL